MKSIIPLILLSVGEAVYIWAEMIIANTTKNNSNNSYLILKMTGVTVIAGLFVVAGYYFGYKYNKNIWVITATSIGAILITEPVISWLMFHEIPNRGASIGLLFGILGIFATLFL